MRSRTPGPYFSTNTLSPSWIAAPLLEGGSWGGPDRVGLPVFQSRGASGASGSLGQLRSAVFGGAGAGAAPHAEARASAGGVPCPPPAVVSATAAAGGSRAEACASAAGVLFLVPASVCTAAALLGTQTLAWPRVGLCCRLPFGLGLRPRAVCPPPVPPADGAPSCTPSTGSAGLLSIKGVGLPLRGRRAGALSSGASCELSVVFAVPRGVAFSTWGKSQSSPFAHFPRW